MLGGSSLSLYKESLSRLQAMADLSVALSVASKLPSCELSLYKESLSRLQAMADLSLALSVASKLLSCERSTFSSFW